MDFHVWFAVFPRESWASQLLAVISDATALAITWRLLRDHLDKNRALLGLITLILVPLYTVKAEVLAATTVMMPFWAATLLFYLRARRSLTIANAFFAGAFAGLTLLGKYWAVFLFAGMAAAALTGPGTRRFWRSPAPYVMAVGAIVVVAPHLWWTLSHSVSVQFAESVIVPQDERLQRFGRYIVSAIAYVIVPILFLVGLKPSRTALRDIALPADEIRRQAFVLLYLPLVLPALLELVIPYRLTADWTAPNWPLLPLVLYGSRYLVVDARAPARDALIGLAIVLSIVMASPVIAYVSLYNAEDRDERMFTRQIANAAQNLAGTPIEFITGSARPVASLPFYLPRAQVPADPLSAAGRALLAAHDIVIVCTSADVECQNAAKTFVHDRARSINATFRRSFLVWWSQPQTFQITFVPRST
jgi:Dolichyl-phosphate-mannose-protein mannosyltransferase